MQSHDQRGVFDENNYRRSFSLNAGLTGVFGLMFLGLLASAATAFLTASTPALRDLVFRGGMESLIFLAGPILLVIFVFPRVWRMPPAAAFFTFIFYALLNGFSLSIVFLLYDLGTITLAFLATAGMFGVMAVYGAVTKADLSRAGSFFIMGLFGFVIATVINIFLASDTLDIIIIYAGIAIFLGLTAYDVQRIKRAMEASGSSSGGVMVMGALHLYLDFINILLLLLRLMGRSRGRR